MKSYKNVASEVARGSEDIPRAQDPEQGTFMKISLSREGKGERGRNCASFMFYL